MNAAAARLAFLLGLALAAAFGSTIIAFKFDHAAELGQPWLGWLYDPRSAWAWWQAWGHAPPYRTLFQEALGIALVVAVLPVAGLRMVYLYSPLQVGRDPTRRQGMGTVRKLLRSGHIFRNGDGVVLGIDPARGWWRQRTLRDNGDGHVLIMGPSRLGKGAGHVVPTLLNHEGSMLVFDPKHELHRITGACRAELGPVHVVDPTNLHSTRYNPLLELRESPHLIGDCQTVAAVMATSGQGGASVREDPFWDSSAHKLLTAVLAHVVTGDKPTLGEVWRTCLAIAGNRYPAPRDGFVKATLNAHRALDARTRSGVDETLGTHLRFLSDPLIRRMTAASDFRAGDLVTGPNPVTVFLSVPVIEGKRLRPFTRLMLESMIAALTHDLHLTSDNRAKQRPLLALIDEFPHLGRLDVIERQMPIMASYGVRLCLICQDEDQIGNLYGAKQAITANCSTIAYIPGFSAGSLQTVARWGGQHAVAHSSKQLPAGIKGAGSVTQSETRVALLETGEMLERGKDEVLIFTHGVPPTYLRKLRYWKELEFRGLWDVDDGRATAAPTPLPPEHSETDDEQSANDPVDNSGQGEQLSDDDREVIAGLEGLVGDLSPAALAALRQRLSAAG